MDDRNGLAVPRSLQEACDPKRLALLVYDMQVGILGQIGDRDRVVARTVEVVEAARAAGVRTFFLRHVTLPTALMGVSQLRMWRSWQRTERAADVVSPFPPDAPQTQLIPELRPTEHEAVLDKITMSAFEGTWLDIALRDCGITTVAVVGVATEIGIEPTVRHAADLGYLPVVITDACGPGDPEAGERSLATLRFAGDAFLTTTDEFRKALPTS
ncbi:cysteine hydrolase family protein [Streptomyces sp. SAJ15]|uniref:cysteine hydrolase family protein n=1 Tax=Streptomyces sp. SAJ15 TaxID=2011095 RepID=UPI001186FD93|nr:cysteine hydrolase [Streptomyces sp. SAJ15]TVL91602.1 isochorismatase [Streptomyces sp. SAJ15]